MSKAVCPECMDGIEMVRAFFQKCFNANQELIIALRKQRPSPLDLPSHINQYKRSFNPPVVPQIKIEPSTYLDDVDLGHAIEAEKLTTNGYYDDEWIVDEELDDEDMDEDLEDSDDTDEDDTDEDEEDDIFKVHRVPGKKKTGKKKGSSKKFSLSKTNGSNNHRAGRKRFVPLALKTCSQCGKEFSDHAGNLSHWKEIHPDMEVVYKCLEVDRSTGTLPYQPCNFTSKESEDIFKHRSKHKIRNDNLPDIKPEVNIE